MKTEILIAILGAAAIAFIGYTEGYDACQKKHDKEAAALRAQHDKQVNEINQALAEARRAESAARSDTERMRRQVNALRKAADTPATERCAGLADVAVRQKEALDRAATALEFCDRALR